MPKLTLALDWTPNINHIGFFIAQEKGFYHESGIELEIVDPSTDNYAVTPAKKVELGTIIGSVLTLSKVESAKGICIFL